ncbi:MULTISPECIES: phosphotransferase family protein [Mycobacteriaceae]|uniref:phosphotransferase family protein n=1 Tax=Mycobacteriaceae TaxID=1762 RepID=UPI00080210DC|nr:MULTISPECIES: phosphotransferase family protein [Mycobacteriaceae]MCK0175009.1 phosphotransferase family protein [Mycolicibacterium sp. F2034L]OBB61357.1 acyl-CoA dehydrogenase [Mycobacterium sp. 852013-51886_SCH5428379]
MTELALEDLAARLARAGVLDVRPLRGGASSLTYAGVRDGAPVVVKVAPPGVAPTGHRDVLRQARILRALESTPVPVPVVLDEDAGAPPAVPPLFVMSLLPGDSVEPLFDAADDIPEDIPDAVVAQRFRHAATTMAVLHEVAPESAGLAGEPVVGPADEIARWERTLSTVDPALAPGWDQVAAALRASLPDAAPPAIVHGDFRLGNLLADGAAVTAVIDWEIWSVGDPRVDVGWFLINSDPLTYRRPTAYVDVVPTRAELLACYGDIRDVDWFAALACFKSCATWALIVKHNRRRATPDADLDAMAGALPHLLDRARNLLA